MNDLAQIDKLDGDFNLAIEQQVATLGSLLEDLKTRIVTAESCTGGWLSAALTSVAGSSKWFGTGVCTYANSAKVQILGVSEQMLVAHGAVSKEVVQAMASGALRLDPGAVISVAISGVAGPGQSAAHSAGTVYMAWMLRGQQARIQKFIFDGTRNEVRLSSIKVALRGAIQDIEALMGT
ncbi:MAG: CinA family protein [Gammaproteobacteria bacterium]